MFKRLSVKLSLLLMVVMLMIMAAFTAYLVRDRSKQLNGIILKKGIASAKTGARIVSNILDGIVDNGIFTLDEVFDRTMKLIDFPKRIMDAYKDVSPEALSEVVKYHYATTLDSYLDNVILEMQDEFLKDPQIVFAVLVDDNGYLPTHNSIYSKRLTGDLIYDRNNNRTKRVFDDEVGLNAAKNVDKPYLKQIYRRDTGEVMWDISSPVLVKGRHWGAFRIGLSMEETAKAITALRWKLIISMALLSVIIVLIINRVTAFMMKPLRSLHRGVEQAAKGDLSYKQEVTSQDEVGDLARAFNKIVRDLTGYIDELKRTTAAKERIESELKIAHDIQMGILPKIFPPFPDKSEFDIYATIEPAKEVGGDLYDFFFIDDDHLCFAVGDVSGKGVPASLFMAVTKTLTKTKATKGLTPDTVLSRVNEDLSMDNAASMFVTLFLGILNIRTGELLYCNGGHNHPYLIRKDGDLGELETTNGMALGVMEDFPYQSRKIVLQKEDTLFLYTDGVTEAMNEREELFSEERLKKEINALRDKSIQQIVAGIMQKTKAFSYGVPQTDDIAMMLLRFYGE